MRGLKAAELRQSLGRVARELEDTGEPILLTLGHFRGYEQRSGCPPATFEVCGVDTDS